MEIFLFSLKMAIKTAGSVGLAETAFFFFFFRPKYAYLHSEILLSTEYCQVP